MELVDGDDLNALEARVDQWRAGIAIPKWSLEHARWNVLSVTEDMFRLRVQSVRAQVVEIGQYLQLIDDYKYMLKYTLAHIQNLPSAGLRERPSLNEDEYSAAFELLNAHADYNDAMAAFSGTRAGSVRCYRDDVGRYLFTNSLTFERQANDILESRTATPQVTPLILLFQFLFQPDELLPPALARCVRRVRTSTGDVRPRIGEEVIVELDDLLGARRPVIPQHWRCTLGTGEQIANAFRNLSLVSVAHVIAITNGAMREHAPDRPNGLLVKWLLGETTPNWLSQVLMRRDGVSRNSALELIALLTYGAGTDHPDPALQFLFPLRASLLAIPWFLFATCNAERNFLALLARARRAEFDSASAAFEESMLGDLGVALASRSWSTRLSSYVPGERDAGEVDAIIADADSAFVLVVEMRWFLEPSEVSEVRERERAGASKARQAQRKRDAVRRSLGATLQALGVDEGGKVWTVHGVAVFDNYLPTPDGDDIPFISHRAFISGIYREARLAALHDWIRNGGWLPRADTHFLIEPVDTTLGDIEIRLDGLNPTPEGEDFVLERDEPLLRAWGLTAGATPPRRGSR